MKTAISMGITVITNTHIPMSIKVIMHIRVIITNILHDVLFHLSYITFSLLCSHTLCFMPNLQICTWNAPGLMSSAYYLSNVLENESIYICGISEH